MDISSSELTSRRVQKKVVKEANKRLISCHYPDREMQQQTGSVSSRASDITTVEFTSFLNGNFVLSLFPLSLLLYNTQVPFVFHFVVTLRYIYMLLYCVIFLSMLFIYFIFLNSSLIFL